ncbi:hypothetical protein ACRQ5Q_08700 [Bradyrhizobium sp. PMVTL-01]|uniref:hypothetical protein n=1 Tax=Bradyrhizobium sp. PMVTL-01 TaxID=3434999 RepID=UPI003F71A42D
MAGRKRSPIDRRFAAEAMQTAAVVSMGPADMIIFVDAWGNPDQRFDSRQLAGLPADLCDLLVEAFREHCVAQQPTTHKTTWSALRRFTSFVVYDGMIKAASDLDTAALGRMYSGSRSKGHRGHHAGPTLFAFDLLRPLLFWCQRNRRERLARARDPLECIPRAKEQPRRRLPPEQLKGNPASLL